MVKYVFLPMIDTIKDFSMNKKKIGGTLVGTTLHYYTLF